MLRVWVDLYFEATQESPFRTLREIEERILPRVLRRFGVAADAAPYVDLFFEVTTRVELYPEALGVLQALAPVRAVDRLERRPRARGAVARIEPGRVHPRCPRASGPTSPIRS